MTIGHGPDVLALEMKTALLALASDGLTVRIEPALPTRMPSLVRWRVARQHRVNDTQYVLAVVPEVEGRIECASRSWNQ